MRSRTTARNPYFLSYATILIASIVFACLVFLAPRELSGPSGLWAFFLFDEYTVAWQWGFVLAPGLVTLLIHRPVSGFFSAKTNSVQTRFSSHWFGPALFLVAFFLFWIFREQRHWGDAARTVRILEGAIRATPLGRYFWRNPLDRLMDVVFYTQLNKYFGWGPADSIALLSCLAGAGFVVVLFFLSRFLGRDRYERFFLFFFTLSMGASQLFFGHVEAYTFVTLAILVCILASIRFLRNQTPLYLVYLSAAFAVTIHPLSSMMFPAMLALPFLRNRSLQTIRSTLAAAVPGILYFIAFYVFCRAIGAIEIDIGWNRLAYKPRVFWSFSQVFTAAHLSDVVQNYLLMAPIGICVIVGDRLARRQNQNSDSVRAFLWIMTIAFFVFVLFFNTTLNRLMDWDCLAPAALPAALLAACVHISSNRGPARNYLPGLFALNLSLSCTAAWIAGNYLNNRLPF